MACVIGCQSNKSADQNSANTSDSNPSSIENQASNPPAFPQYAGNDICAGCHEEHYLLWKEGGHNKVSCETCHGPAGDHIRLDVEPRQLMKLPGEAKLCLSCHGPSAGSLHSGIPRVESLEAHVKFVGEKHSVKTDVEKTKGRCIFCHDPHSLE